MKSTNVPAYAERPPTRCGWCLKGAWSTHDTCRECRSIEANLRHGYTDAHALTGGEWVNRRGVWTWTGPRPADDAQIAQRRNAARCGTDSGYRRHVRRHEAACEPCKAAHTEANKRYAA